MPADVHIINKQVFEFECEQSEHAFQIQKKTDHVVQDKIAKTIDRVCSQLAVENFHFQIPLFEINLGRISFDRLEEEIVSVFEKAFYEKLAEWKNNNFENKSAWVSKQQSSFEIVKFFLLTGRLPWFAGKPGKKYADDLFAELLSAPREDLENFILLNLPGEKFIERLAGQLDTMYINYIINLSGISADLIFEIEEEIKKSFEEIILQIRNTPDESETGNEVLSLLEKDKEAFKAAEKLLIEFLNNNKSADSEGKPVKDKKHNEITKILKDDPGTAVKPEIKYEEEHDWPEKARIQLHKIAFEFAFKLVSGKNKISTGEQFYEQFKKMLGDKFEFSPGILKLLSQKEATYYNEFLIAVNQEKEKIEKNQYDLKQEEKQNARTEKPERFYISNAGLVIISNYFPVFFKELQLLENGNFTGKQSQVKAVFLLHYLCTGEETVPEYTLPLNKILCGLSLDEPLPSFVSLSEKEKNECNELLNEIIINWQKLGNSSVEALREAFLNRDGILSLENNGWKLQVERKGYDVLLDSLPWSFNHVKLSWMENIITTEW